MAAFDSGYLERPPRPELRDYLACVWSLGARLDGRGAARRQHVTKTMIPAQLNVVTLGVRDLARMREFYAALGWPLAIEAEDFAAFGLRGALLALFPLEKLAADGQAEAAAPERGMRGFSLAVTVEDPEQVDDAVETARAAGARISKEPGDPVEFEGRHAYFADPEDNYWEVVYLASGGAAQEAVRRATG